MTAHRWNAVATTRDRGVVATGRRSGLPQEQRGEPRLLRMVHQAFLISGRSAVACKVRGLRDLLCSRASRFDSAFLGVPEIPRGVLREVPRGLPEIPSALWAAATATKTTGQH